MSNLTPMNASEFVKPYSIPELNGELGLSAHDIARGLGVDPRSVHEKLRRGNWYNCREWLVIPYTILNENNGLGYTSYYLNLRAAKAFVARWKNKIGDGYLNHLFDCEQGAAEEMPLLKQIIERLTAPRKKRTSKGIYIEREKVSRVKTIFGEDIIEIEKERIPLSKATPAELEEWRVKHRQRTMEGIMTAQSRALIPEDFRPKKPKLRLAGKS